LLGTCNASAPNVFSGPTLKVLRLKSLVRRSVLHSASTFHHDEIEPFHTQSRQTEEPYPSMGIITMRTHISALAFVQRQPSIGPASPCKRIDPRTGKVIEVLTRPPLQVEKVKTHDWAHPVFAEMAAHRRKRQG
jgi:hypothetical protein